MEVEITLDSDAHRFAALEIINQEQNRQFRCLINTEMITMTTAYRSPLEQLQQQCSMFSNISSRYLLELESEGAIRTYLIEQGESITFKGRSGDDAIFLLKGVSNVTRAGKPQFEWDEGNNSCRPVELQNTTTTIVATQDSLLCRTDRDKLDYLIGWNAMVKYLDSFDQGVHSVLAGLRHPVVFENLPFSKVEEAFKRMTTRDICAGEVIMRQGDLGDFFYIIDSGRAEVWQKGPYDDNQKLVATLEKRDHCGDEALLTCGTRNATVKMIEAGRLLVLKKEDFDELIAKPMVHQTEPKVVKALMDSGTKVIDVRYQEEWEELRIPGVLLIPLHEMRARINELSKSLQYITYCLSGKRSLVAAMIMNQQGYNAMAMAGGIRDWPYETESSF